VIKRMKGQKTYEERREEIYAPLRAEGIFTWDHLYGEEYALAGICPVSAAFRQELADAAAQLAAIFAKVVPVVQQAPVPLLTELGIPEAAQDAVRLPVLPEWVTVVGRFDFAATPAGLKMLELNSDTPTGIVEAFHVNGHVCRYFGLADPNEGMAEQLSRAFARIVQQYRQWGYPVEQIVFSALDWHEEDAGTTRYLLKQSGLTGRFVPLSDLRVYEDGLYVLRADGLEPIDVLYRLHALEKLAEETDTDGYPTGAHVLRLVAERKLALINPPSAFVAQTKALQALIWSLHEAGEFFTEAEHAIIERYMLPTYFENRFQGRAPYVTKPIFGREGGGVVLHEADGTIDEQDREEHYWEQPMIYQQRVELPEVEVETMKGKARGRLLWGTFLIGGEASAIVARVGGRITNNLSWYLPTGIQT